MKYELIPFEDHQIHAIEQDGKIYIVMKPIVDALGLTWSSQYMRIKRDPLLSKGVLIMRIPPTENGVDMIVLELKRFHGWLLGISSNAIPDQNKREVILRYQDKAHDVIASYFHPELYKVPLIGGNLPVRDMISLQKERDRLMSRFLREKDKMAKLAIFEDMARTILRLGGTVPSIQELESTKPELIAGNVFELLAHLKTFEAQELEWNLHKDYKNFIAINPVKTNKFLKSNNIDFEITPEIYQSAGAHPAFVRYTTYRTRLGKAERCLIFTKGH